MALSPTILRHFCLVLIVVQNSSLILVTSYSRTLKPAYLPSVAVLLAEVIKVAMALLFLAWELGSASAAVRETSSLLREHGRETLKFAVPALCYTLQNHLWYYALSHLDPVAAAVTSQMKVVTTAIASVLMLSRRLTRIQWISIAVLAAGMIVMQVSSRTTRPKETRRSAPVSPCISSMTRRQRPPSCTHAPPTHSRLLTSRCLKWPRRDETH